MSKAVILVGRVGSGKTFYAKELLKKGGAVLLSVDEIMLALFGNDAGEKHDFYATRTQKYLFEKSIEILASGKDVILDWGFWRRCDRDSARAFYAEAGYACEAMYLDVSKDVRRRNIAARNMALQSGAESAYFMDDSVADKFDSFFEVPTDDEDYILVLGEEDNT